jgi:hypothetical protein
MGIAKEPDEAVGDGHRLAVALRVGMVRILADLRQKYNLNGAVVDVAVLRSVKIFLPRCVVRRRPSPWRFEAIGAISIRT